MYWECIYILNLDRIKHNYEEMLERLFLVGITPLNTTIVRWTGLNGRSKLPFGKEIYAIDTIDKKKELIEKMNTVLKEQNIIYKNIKSDFIPEQIGIYLSFTQIIEHAKYNSYSNILILGDNVFFDSDFINLAKEIKNKKEDVIFFGSEHHNWNTQLKKTGSNKEEKIIDNIKNDTFLGTFAYSIRKDAYDKILKDSRPMRYDLDIYLGKLYGKNKITVLFYKNPPVYIANNAYFYT